MYNEKLAERMKPLYREAHKLYADVAKQADQMYLNTDEWNIHVAISKLDERITTIEGFVQCIEIMENTADISRRFNKNIGSGGYLLRIGYAQDILLDFLHRSFTAEDTDFEPNYEKFEQFFYEDCFVIKMEARLYNFESPLREIKLGDNLRIVKRIISIEDEQYMYLLRHGIHSGWDFVLEKLSRRKMYGLVDEELEIASINQQAIETSEEATITAELFDQVIKALRLLKNSAIHRSEMIEERYESFVPQSGIVTRPGRPTFVSGKICELGAEGVTELQDTFERITNLDNEAKVALNRLSFGMERPTKEDAILDYVIGLEALYNPSDHEELSFRVSLGVAFILHGDDPLARRATFDFIRRMYRVRSKFAHGDVPKAKDFDADSDFIPLENMLRDSLKLYLDNAESFKDENLIKLYLGA